MLRLEAGKPKQVLLRRAVSTAYYAMFHALARSNANLLVGGTGAARSDEAWRQAYRALEHGFARNACMNSDMVSKFPKEIQNFANAFVTMQEKRHKADYDPIERFTKSAVQQDIDLAEQTITDFGLASTKDRRAFAAHVLFKSRK